MRNTSGLEKFKKIKKLKQRIVFCPIAKVRAMVSPLTVGDDLQIRTMISTPDLYDQYLTEMIYQHTEFPDFEKRPDFKEFSFNTSNFDKKVLLWGVFTATYETFGKQSLKCPNCKHEFEDEVKSEELIHPDFAAVWDNELSFKEHRVAVEVNMGLEEISKLIFKIAIPCVQDHFDVLKFVSNEKLLFNYEKFGTLLSKTEELALITNSIEMYDTPDATSPSEVLSDRSDIYVAVKNYISVKDADVVTKEYVSQFSKYNPTFKKQETCPSCNHNFDFEVDIEVALFHSFFG